MYTPGASRRPGVTVIVWSPSSSTRSRRLRRRPATSNSSRVARPPTGSENAALIWLRAGLGRTRRAAGPVEAGTSSVAKGACRSRVHVASTPSAPANETPHVRWTVPAGASRHDRATVFWKARPRGLPPKRPSQHALRRERMGHDVAERERSVRVPGAAVDRSTRRCRGFPAFENPGRVQRSSAVVATLDHDPVALGDGDGRGPGQCRGPRVGEREQPPREWLLETQLPDLVGVVSL